MYVTNSDIYKGKGRTKEENVFKVFPIHKCNQSHNIILYMYVLQLIFIMLNPHFVSSARCHLEKQRTNCSKYKHGN